MWARALLCRGVLYDYYHLIKALSGKIALLRWVDPEVFQFFVDEKSPEFIELAAPPSARTVTGAAGSAKLTIGRNEGQYYLVQ